MNLFEQAANEVEKGLYTGETMQENVIEFLRNAKTATVNFCQGRFVSQIKRLAEERPDEVQIVAENKDGTIVAHIPAKWVKIRPARVLDEEEKERLREAMKRVREGNESMDEDEEEDEEDEEEYEGYEEEGEEEDI